MTTRFEELREIMTRLRGPDGCPWDREQTHLSLRPYLIEEAYEVLEAIDGGEPGELQEELGDLLLQIIFHSQIAQENGEFDVEDVIGGIAEKLIRRHPHVFGDRMVCDSGEVVKRWEQIKQQEAGDKNRTDTSILSGIPRELPALLKAHRVQEKAARVGFDWDHIDKVFAKLDEELAEFRTAYRRCNREAVEEELGDVFFTLVNLARFLETNPEDALRRTIDKFIERFQYVESRLHDRGLQPQEVGLQEMDRLWEEAKALENGPDSSSGEDDRI